MMILYQRQPLVHQVYSVNMKLKYCFYRRTLFVMIAFLFEFINLKNTRKGIMMDKADAKTAMEVFISFYREGQIRQFG